MAGVTARLVAAVATTGGLAVWGSEGVSAHEKWFVDADPFPVDWSAAFGFPANVGVIAAVLLALLVGWLSAVRGGRDCIPGPARFGATARGRAMVYGLVPLILGVHVGVPLIVFGMRGELFSPNNDLAPPWTYWLGLAEIGIGLSLLYGIMTRPAAVLLAALWGIGIWVRGLELMLENLYYLGFAAFFALSGRGPFAADRVLFPALEPPARLALLAMPSLRIATGIALVVVAFTEKLANPALSLAFLAEYPVNFTARAGVALSDQSFVALAGAIELFVGLCVVFGYFPRPVIIVTWIFINMSLTIFNFVELLGHLPLYGIMAVFLVWRPGRVDTQLWLRGVLGGDHSLAEATRGAAGLNLLGAEPGARSAVVREPALAER